MFSGIIDAIVPALSMQAQEGLCRLRLQRPPHYDDIRTGDSISVDGVCLTVESFDDQSMTFALAAETLKVLNWQTEFWQERRFNLEKSLRYGDRLHGHMVSGHVDSLGKIVRRSQEGESLFLDVEISPALRPFVWHKGSIALHGVSLTINSVVGDILSVCLIPETQKRTNLSMLKVGDVIHVEPDLMARATLRAQEIEAPVAIETKFHSTAELIEEIRLGRMVLLIDDEDRENEGDLVLAADHVTAEAINFMVTEARGLVCLALTAEQIDRLQLPQMVRDEENLSPNKTAFTVSIEAANGVSTGISVADRAQTVRVASDPKSGPADLHKPGHIFPIRARQGGVLTRAGHTEGSVDLAMLAGLTPAAVICEVMNKDGSMARVPELRAFARRHQIKIGTIADLIQTRLRAGEAHLQ